jgi:hypothetical protein
MERIIYPKTFKKYFLLLILSLILGNNQAVAQLYIETVGGVFPLNICNCTVGAPVVTVGSAAISIVPNQNPYYLANEELLELNLATGISTVVASSVLNQGNSMVTATNGIVYILGGNASGTTGLLTAINPSTGVVTNIGELPTGFFPTGDLFFSMEICMLQ